MQEAFKKIIEKLEEMKHDNPMVTDSYILRESAIESVKEVSAKYNNGWIPCNGVLYPDDMEDVLISMGGLKAIPAYRQNGKWYLTDCRGSSTEVKDQFRVTAWQPLPEPYQPKGE